MKILVTGGAGFIGSAIVQQYLELGHAVTVVDDLSAGKRERVPSEARLIQMDILAPELSDVFAEGGFDVVNHQAAHVSVRESIADPLHDARVNALGTLSVLQLAARHGVRRCIYAASVAGYGEPKTLPVTEQHPLHPLSPYGISKMAGEQYGLYLHTATGMEFTSLRYANVYGPAQNAEGEAGVVTIFVNQMLRGQPPTIFGDGEQTRDFVHVQDVARANVLALSDDRGGCFNISTGLETSVNALFRILKRLIQFGGEPIHAPALVGEIRRIYLDNHQAKRLLQWHPVVPLLDGLADVVGQIRTLDQSPTKTR